MSQIMTAAIIILIQKEVNNIYVWNLLHPSIVNS